MPIHYLLPPATTGTATSFAALAALAALARPCRIIALFQLFFIGTVGSVPIVWHTYMSRASQCNSMAVVTAAAVVTAILHTKRLSPPQPACKVRVQGLVYRILLSSDGSTGLSD